MLRRLWSASCGHASLLQAMIVSLIDMARAKVLPRPAVPCLAGSLSGLVQLPRLPWCFLVKPIEAELQTSDPARPFAVQLSKVVRQQAARLESAEAEAAVTRSQLQQLRQDLATQEQRHQGDLHTVSHGSGSRQWQRTLLVGSEAARIIRWAQCLRCSTSAMRLAPVGCDTVARCS